MRFENKCKHNIRMGGVVYINHIRTAISSHTSCDKQLLERHILKGRNIELSRKIIAPS